MATPPFILLSDERCLDHATWGAHPETRDRVTAVRGRLRSGVLSDAMIEGQPRSAAWDTILAAHEEEYLLRFEEAALSGREWFDHRDNQLGEASYQAALLAASSGPTAIDLIEAGRAPVAFCAVRPPGHHAERSQALGFCFLNNAVIAARHWQRAHGRRRVLVLDFDAHHGNGIQHAFDADPDVLYVSLHEHPTFSFPGTGYAEETGTGPGEGATLNIPLLPGARDAEALEALEARIDPAVRAFRPEAIVVAAGFDGHLLDDMSGLGYSTNLFRRFGRAVALWSNDRAGGRSLTILEGGYHLGALCDGVEQYLLGLAGADAANPHDPPFSKGEDARAASSEGEARGLSLTTNGIRTSCRVPASGNETGDEMRSPCT
jgi:acetoin utilization deacetylase AcuC-like enzyme